MRPPPFSGEPCSPPNARTSGVVTVRRVDRDVVATENRGGEATGRVVVTAGDRGVGSARGVAVAAGNGGFVARDVVVPTAHRCFVAAGRIGASAADRRSDPAGCVEDAPGDGVVGSLGSVAVSEHGGRGARGRVE